MNALVARLKASRYVARRLQPSVIYVTAAVLTAAALAVPLWGFAMSAPQYPDETLHLRVERTGIAGDVHEVQTLQHYIGVRFPTDLPELTWAVRVIAGLAVALGLAAFAGNGRIGRVYRAGCALAVVAFVVASAVAVQGRLYKVGHERDPRAPIRAVRDFTPPLIGPVRVGNFTVWSFPHVGAVLLLMAAVVSVAGLRQNTARGEPVESRGSGSPFDKLRTSGKAIAAALFAVVAASRTAEAREWTVGGSGSDFPLIAPAIAAAASGDVIHVRAGVYREDLTIDKRLTIAGDDNPVLFGTGIGTVVTVAAAGCELSGFVIEGSGTGQANAMDAGVHVRSNGNRIVNNTLRRVFYGIVVTDATHNEIADNDIQGFHELPFGQRGDGIYLYRAPENFVARNRVSGERDAIYFQYAPRGRAVDNIVSNSRYGLHDMFSDDAVIARNEFRDSAVGANIMNSRRIRIENNRILRNRGIPGIGITLKDCDDSTVGGNTIAGNARGLLLDGSSTNRFVDNRFDANDTAVTLFSSAERNRFSGNQFSGNWSDVVLSGRDSGTVWSDNGRGNYWSHYRGFDFDDDGVGESPHPLLGAFERIEGLNPATRLFLQSPAAAGLEFAARLSGVVADDAIDAHPLARPPSGSDPDQIRIRSGSDQDQTPGHRGPSSGTVALVIGVAACAAVITREKRKCSR
jgi:nitrous oxidase accessory protein